MGWVSGGRDALPCGLNRRQTTVRPCVQRRGRQLALKKLLRIVEAPHAHQRFSGMKAKISDAAELRVLDSRQQRVEALDRI